jgi:quinoprotein glucose dehydrogenase
MSAIQRRSLAAAFVLAGSLSALVRSEPAGVNRSFKTWSQYLGGADSSQYSSLDDFNKSTVSRLEVAWRYPSGDTRSYRFNPIVMDGTMYVLAKDNSIVALDPLTGREKWSHANKGAVGDRGINYWESRDRSDRRLLYLNAGYLTAIDARTGAAIPSFGDQGRVDLRIGPGRDRTNMRPLQTNNPGRIYQDLFIISLPAGGAGYVANPGDVHAYDVRTGKQAWVFHTVPVRGEAGAETWPDVTLETGSGVHNWAELTVDEGRGIVYIPTGTARYDFYGGNRQGANLYANSIVALDAKTGKHKWHFQAVHHDLWDYDLATAPKLLTVKHDGRDVDVVAQASKHGFLFVLERDTGKPLWPIEERPVPQSDVPGEQTSPTQPFPTAPPPFARQSFTEKDVNPYISPESQAQLRELVRNSVNKGLFTPPSLQGSMQIPGNSGGANWGLSAADPVKGRVYVVSKEAPAILKLREMKAGTPAEPRGPDMRTLPPNPPAGFVPYTAVAPYGWVDKPSGLPTLGPPWSQITAFDLNKGTLLWQVPNGDTRQLVARGIRGTGAQGARAGMVVTAGGVLFIGTPDHKLRAYDEDTGKVVWEHEVSGPINGVPAIYELGGRQYLAVCVGAPGDVDTDDSSSGAAPAAKGGSEYVVFALPRR